MRVSAYMMKNATSKKTDLLIPKTPNYFEKKGVEYFENFEGRIKMQFNGARKKSRKCKTSQSGRRGR